MGVIESQKVNYPRSLLFDLFHLKKEIIWQLVMAI